jgi:hypothetical protein
VRHLFEKELAGVLRTETENLNCKRKQPSKVAAGI